MHQTPEEPNELHDWITRHTGITIDKRPGTNGAGGPFDYLIHSYFEGRASPPALQDADAIVCAGRGGGKTFLGALATTIDLVFKPGIQIRILAGSVEQGQRMHQHLRALFANPTLQDQLARPVEARAVTLTNGSSAHVLAQAHTSVRGTRVQKVRCDEVELFDRDIWQAAQLTTRTLERPGPWGPSVRGRIDCLSTMHLPFGIMSDLVARARAENHTHRLFQWGVGEMLCRCRPRARCDSCALNDECAGRAKSDARGHMTIADARSLKGRVDTPTWEAEMRNTSPSRASCVYPEFDEHKHVFEAPPEPDDSGATWICGVDFGFRAPTVILFAQVDRNDTLRVFAERVAREVTLDRHIESIHASPWPQPAWVAVDPAGDQRNDQTGLSPISAMRNAHLNIRARRVNTWAGISRVRCRLAAADNTPPRLLIHRRCTRLIEAMRTYHFDPDKPSSIEPVKDGADHACDALRYLVINLDHPYTTNTARYT